MGVDPLDRHRHTTEHRQQFQANGVGLGATMPKGWAASATPGRSGTTTATEIGLPWVEPIPALEPPAYAKPWAPVKAPDAMWASETATAFASGEPRPEPYYKRSMPAAASRFLEAPEVPRAGGGISGRPTASFAASARSQDAFTASSRANLSGAAFLLKDSVAAAAAEHAAGVARAMRPVGLKGTYTTSHQLSNSAYSRADMQQQRVRAQVTSRLLDGMDALGSAPTKYVAASVPGATAMHAQRFTPVRGGDGSHRYIEIVPPKA